MLSTHDPLWWCAVLDGREKATQMNFYNRIVCRVLISTLKRARSILGEKYVYLITIEASMYRFGDAT